jgi:hypothetical protein
MLLRVIQRRVCGFTIVSEAEIQKGRMDEIAMKELLNIQSLGNI